MSRDTTPMLRYRGVDIREALHNLRSEVGDPYEGVSIRLVNPTTGRPLFPTQDYVVNLLRPGQSTAFKRETASTLYLVMDGEGYSEIGEQRFDWKQNDIIVAPNFRWRRHVNTGSSDAVLYAISDSPLMHSIGQYRSQGRLAGDQVVELG